MDLEIKTQFRCTFRVEAYSGNEGGMDYETFGSDVNSLKEALQLWHLATIKEPKADWIIGCHPEVKVV